jgi:hypothetical protein
MLFQCRARSLGVLFPLLVIFACATPPPPPPAERAAPPTPPPPPEISTIVVPIRTSLAALTPEIEARVPKTFAGKETERGIDVRYDVARDPIRLEMIGAGLHATTTVKYAMEACRGRFPCISCGFGETRRVADIRLQTKLDWDPSWRLRSATRLLPIHYAKPCEVTWLDIDVTRRFVAPVVEEQLGRVATLIDRSTPGLTNLRPHAEQIWKSLQAPTELAPRTWLVLEPSAVALTPITGSGAIAQSTLVLRATTRVVIGNKPAVAGKPLPSLTGAPGSQPGVRVPVDILLPYAEAANLAQKNYTIGGKPLVVESLKLSPAGNGRVLVEANIDYRGGGLRNYRGAVFLEGTPRFDPVASRVIVPDLDYSLDSKRRGFFARIAERAAHDSIRSRLRDSARFDLGARMKNVQAEITRALNRQLAPGVTLAGKADAIETKSVTPTADGFVVRVVVTGSAAVDLANVPVR